MSAEHLTPEEIAAWKSERLQLLEAACVHVDLSRQLSDLLEESALAIYADNENQPLLRVQALAKAVAEQLRQLDDAIAAIG